MAVHALPFSQAPYKVGERLTYIVSYSNFPERAHVEVEVVSRGNSFGRDAIQLQAHVETTGVINVASVCAQQRLHDVHRSADGAAVSHPNKLLATRSIALKLSMSLINQQAKPTPQKQ